MSNCLFHKIGRACLLLNLLSTQITTSALSTFSVLNTCTRTKASSCGSNFHALNTRKSECLHAHRVSSDEICGSENNNHLDEDASEGKITTTSPVNRRMAFGAIAAAVASSALIDNNRAAMAYERTFPSELDADEAVTMSRSKDKVAAKKSPLDTSPAELLFGSVLWGGALWLLSGSRSNPLVTPLANIIYDEEKESWLKDRNDGLFGSLPAPLLFLLGLIFVVVGFGVDILALSASNGDVSLELAGTLLIGGASLELGRIASGEKKQTRADYDRDLMLETEFAQFAAQRLKAGGNCHRSEVVGAFRRFYAKYRQRDSTEYPLGDLEIEGLLRKWNDKNARAERTSAGFYNGIQINDQADAFAQR